ncbi:MAG: hypothetical protein M1823_005215 [Watsoniomyces obsoletus]|nr:MAG: hypothetical protein M1823_005215 [Watsoniomyces obsoletus]
MKLSHLTMVLLGVTSAMSVPLRARDRTSQQSNAGTPYFKEVSSNDDDESSWLSDDDPTITIPKGVVMWLAGAAALSMSVFAAVWGGLEGKITRLGTEVDNLGTSLGLRDRAMANLEREVDGLRGEIRSRPQEASNELPNAREARKELRRMKEKTICVASLTHMLIFGSYRVRKEMLEILDVKWQGAPWTGPPADPPTQLLDKVYDACVDEHNAYVIRGWQHDSAWYRRGTWKKVWEDNLEDAGRRHKEEEAQDPTNSIRIDNTPFAMIKNPKVVLSNLQQSAHQFSSVTVPQMGRELPANFKNQAPNMLQSAVAGLSKIKAPGGIRKMAFAP